LAPIPIKASAMAFSDGADVLLKVLLYQDSSKMEFDKPPFFSSCDLDGITCSTSQMRVVKLLHIIFKGNEAFTHQQSFGVAQFTFLNAIFHFYTPTVFLVSLNSPFSMQFFTLAVLLTNLLNRLNNPILFHARTVPNDPNISPSIIGNNCIS
jgi:hypothetical protein